MAPGNPQSNDPADNEAAAVANQPIPVANAPVAHAGARLCTLFSPQSCITIITATFVKAEPTPKVNPSHPFVAPSTARSVPLPAGAAVSVRLF